MVEVSTDKILQGRDLLNYEFVNSTVGAAINLVDSTFPEKLDDLHVDELKNIKSEIKSNLCSILENTEDHITMFAASSAICTFGDVNFARTLSETLKYISTINFDQKDDCFDKNTPNSVKRSIAIKEDTNIMTRFFPDIERTVGAMNEFLSYIDMRDDIIKKDIYTRLDNIEEITGFESMAKVANALCNMNSFAKFDAADMMFLLAKKTENKDVVMEIADYIINEKDNVNNPLKLLTNAYKFANTTHDISDIGRYLKLINFERAPDKKIATSLN